MSNYSRCILLLAILNPFTIVSKAESASSNRLDGEAIDSYLQLLSDTNHFSPMEGAGSHGSLGIGIGAGLSAHSVPSNSPLIEDQIRSSDDFETGKGQKSRDTMMVPRLFAHKGLWVPVDFGIGLAKISATQATSVGTYAQWTAYEAFAMPAIAIRGKYSRLMGLPSTESSNFGGEILASYGFLRVFNLYAGLALDRHHTSIKTKGPSSTTLLLTDDDSEFYSKVKIVNARTIGLQGQFNPLFCTVSIENRKLENQQTWLAKVGFGI